MSWHFPRPWHELQLTAIDPPEDANRVLSTFRALYRNGGAWLAGFQLDYAAFDDVVAGRAAQESPLREVAVGLRMDHTAFVQDFLRSDELRAVEPELARTPDQFDELEISRPRPAFTLDGEISEALFFGGAYERFAGTPAEAKAEAGRLVVALLGDRFNEVYVSSIVDSSSAWARGWTLLDYRLRRVWLLGLWDTD